MQRNLMTLREQKHVSQQDLAKLINVDLTTFIEKENGVSEFTLLEMFIIADFFGFSVNNIFLTRNITNRDKNIA